MDNVTKPRLASCQHNRAKVRPNQHRSPHHSQPPALQAVAWTLNGLIHEKQRVDHFIRQRDSNAKLLLRNAFAP
jgi:hypothetical protein